MQKAKYRVKVSAIAFSIIAILLCNQNSSGQDTIQKGPSYKYSRAYHPVRDKSFMGEVKKGREDIVFSTTKKRVEYCYYYDSLRICPVGTTYELVDDSTLLADKRKWHFKKLSRDSFQMFLVDSIEGVKEIAIANSLMPLNLVGTSVTISLLTSDTLWKSNYDEMQLSPYGMKSKHCLYQTSLHKKYLEFNEIDSPPLLQNGQAFDNLKLKVPNLCFSGDWKFIHSVSFIVDSVGKIHNVVQVEGNYDSGCPYYLLTLAKELTRLKLEPARKDGRAVACRWFITIQDFGDAPPVLRKKDKRFYIKLLKRKDLTDDYFCK